MLREYSPEMVATLTEAVSRGTPWRTALANLLGRELTTCHEAAGNWLWFAEFGSPRRALSIADSAGIVTEALAAHFDTVYAAEPRADISAFVTAKLLQGGRKNVLALRAAPGRLPFLDASFDCVALPGVLDWWYDDQKPRSRAQYVRLLAECRRVLHGAGCCYVAMANPARSLIPAQDQSLSLPYRLACLLRALVRPVRFRTLLHADELGVGPRPRDVTALLHEVGFGRVHGFYADPSHHETERMIPNTCRSVLAYERALHNHARDTRLRQLLAVSGFHSLLYGSVFFLAYP